MGLSEGLELGSVTVRMAYRGALAQCSQLVQGGWFDWSDPGSLSSPSSLRKDLSRSKEVGVKGIVDSMDVGAIEARDQNIIHTEGNNGICTRVRKHTIISIDRAQCITRGGIASDHTRPSSACRPYRDTVST